MRRVHRLTGTRGNGATSLLHLLLAAVTPTAPALLLDSHHRFSPAAMRAHAFPLVARDAGTLPPITLLNRFRPIVRVSERLDDTPVAKTRRSAFAASRPSAA